jgi:hypothetical protein
VQSDNSGAQQGYNVLIYDRTGTLFLFFVPTRCGPKFFCLLRASPTMTQTGALNRNMGLYEEKTTAMMFYFIKFGKKF